MKLRKRERKYASIAKESSVYGHSISNTSRRGGNEQSLRSMTKSKQSLLNERENRNKQIKAQMKEICKKLSKTVL